MWISYFEVLLLNHISVIHDGGGKAKRSLSTPFPQSVRSQSVGEAVVKFEERLGGGVTRSAVVRIEGGCRATKRNPCLSQKSKTQGMGQRQVLRIRAAVGSDAARAQFYNSTHGKHEGGDA